MLPSLSRLFDQGILFAESFYNHRKNTNYEDRNMEIRTGPEAIIPTTGRDRTGKCNNRTGPNFDNRTIINNRTRLDWTGPDQESLPVAQESIVVPQESIIVPQESILVPQELILVPQESILVPQESILVPQESILVAQEPILVPQESGFWIGFGCVLGELWRCVGNPGRSKMSVSYTRGAMFQQFTIF